MSQMVSERLVEYLGEALSNVLVHTGNRVQAVPDLPLLFFEKELKRLHSKGVDDPLEGLSRRKLFPLLDFPYVTGRESASLGELLLSHTEPFSIPPKIVTKKCT